MKKKIVYRSHLFICTFHQSIPVRVATIPLSSFQTDILETILISPVHARYIEFRNTINPISLFHKCSTIKNCNIPRPVKDYNITCFRDRFVSETKEAFIKHRHHFLYA